MVMAAGEPVAQFMREKNREQGQGKGQAVAKREGVHEDQLKGAHELIHGESLIQGIRGGELGAGRKREDERGDEKGPGQEELLERRMLRRGGRSVPGHRPNVFARRGNPAWRCVISTGGRHSGSAGTAETGIAGGAPGTS